MAEFLNMSDHLAALAEVDQLFQRHGVAYWLFGGWAVDFHAGRVTREHGDIDIAIWSTDRERVATLLLGRAWVHREEVGEDGYTCYERNGIRLEVAFLARDGGGHVYTPLRDGRGEWPADSFGDQVAQLRGVRARVIGRESLIADKSIVRFDAVTATKDRADIASLLNPVGRSTPSRNED
jgi:Aminoglycoside-2''-adenylyltransferase